MALLSPQDRYGYCASAVPSAKACGGSFPRKEPCNLHGKRVQLEMRGQPSEGCLSPRGVNLKARRRNANRPYGCESALFAGASKRWSSPAFGASRGAAILESVLPWRPPSVSFRIPSACSTALESWRLLPLAGDNPPPSRPGAPKCLWSSRLSSFRFGGTQSLESEIGLRPLTQDDGTGIRSRRESGQGFRIRRRDRGAVESMKADRRGAAQAASKQRARVCGAEPAPAPLRRPPPYLPSCLGSRQPLPMRTTSSKGITTSPPRFEGRLLRRGCL
jgi:hypothetical protein